MRLSGVLVALAALAACGSAHAQQRETVCEQVLRFESDANRVTFLEANTAGIVAHAATNNVFFASSETEPALTIVSNVDVCPPEGLAAALALEGAFTATQNVTNAQNAYARMSRASFEAVDTGNERVRRCVVRTTLIQPDDPTGLSIRLVYAGLRSSRVIAFEKAAYIGAEEDCVILSGFVDAAFMEMHGRAPVLIACPDGSFASCGYISGRQKAA